MRNIRITVQYDGTDLAGWQRQDAGTTVQALLEDALQRFDGTRVVVHGAGRTDAGVHALGQVASFRLANPVLPPVLARALNGVLPPQVRVLSAEEAPEHFHAQFSATGKVYEYRIVNAPMASPFLHRYAWHVPGPLDPDAMALAAAGLEGTHDFAAFQGSGSAVVTTTRTIRSIEWDPGRGYDLPLVLRIEGDGFLRHMVRNIAGTLVDIGAGRWPPGEIFAILESRDRRRAGRTAPPHGLFLVRVLY